MASGRFSSAAQNLHRRWLEMHLPKTGVAYRNLTDQLHGLAIAGQQAEARDSLGAREVPYSTVSALGPDPGSC